ncbi:MAG: nucleotidyltransferase [Clostridiaceae bacterium]|nr:nucleotidyltransferase [Clostridiaceae bacterium]
MRVLGIIAEYNPFHNGHLYHLKESIALTSADYAVCAMSGNFVQRGEPAVINKWARAKMALMAGIDLVVEIPVAYATASAEYFAHAGVKILDSLGVVDNISFGSETGDIKPLDAIAEILHHEPPSYKSALKSCQDTGLSYPAAVQRALGKYVENHGAPGLRAPEIDQVMGCSNNILGIEYLKALKRLKSNITPVTIKRTANLYTTEYLTGEISSATAIRKNLPKDSPLITGDARHSLPGSSIEILENEFSNGRGPVSLDRFSDTILALIRKMMPEEIKAFPGVTEGLENRVKKAAESCGTIDMLIEKASTRRYTVTRLQRILLYLLLNITSREFLEFNSHGGPQYIRVLGFNEKGAFLLSKIKKRGSLPIIIKVAGFTRTNNPVLNKMLEREAFATDIYVLGYKNPEYRYAGQEFTQNIIRI